MTTMLDTINTVRAAHGVGPLSPNDQLAAAAQGHAEDMATHPGMIHIGSDGSDGGQRIHAAGYQWRQWGEVTGWGFDGDNDRMVDWWLNSPDHRHYLLSDQFTDVGIGYETGGVWGHYWTVDFGRDGATVPAVPPNPPAVPPEAPPPPYHSYVPVTAAPGLDFVDLLRFKIANPDCWRVVVMTRPDGSTHSEDVQDMDLGKGLFVRRKGNNGEWHKVDGQYFYLIHDTSPDKDSQGNERVYSLYKDGKSGAPKSKLVQAVNELWKETGTHVVQFRSKRDCRSLSENSGYASNSSQITRYEKNYTFNRHGQALTFDEVVWEKTGEEMQIYGRKDGRSCGWIGWSAPWGESEPIEVHWDRGRLTREPEIWCSW